MLFLAALFLLPSAGCVGAEDVRNPAEVANVPDATLKTIALNATDYRFEMATKEFPTGALQFEVVNTGSMAHELMVVPMEGERLGVPVAHMELEQGTRQYLRVDLAPGKYQFVCVLQTRTGNGLESHYSLGMAAEVEIEG